MTQDWGTTVFSINDAAPEAIAQQLRPFTYPVGQGLPWDVILDRLDPDGGEVRSSEDWLRFPKGESILIVALFIDGEYVIRWGRADGLRRATGGLIHDCLLGPGDRWSDLRKGWAELRQDGKVQVTN
jgi:hypothetical protein